MGCRISLLFVGLCLGLTGCNADEQVPPPPREPPVENLPPAAAAKLKAPAPLENPKPILDAGGAAPQKVAVEIPRPTKPSPKKKTSVFEIPKPRPAQTSSCEEKSKFSEVVYQKALQSVLGGSCQKDSDCTLARNTTRCAKKSPCKTSSYVGVPTKNVKKLKTLGSKLYEEICTQSCVKLAWKCRKPPMAARCEQRKCQRVDDQDAFNLKLKIGELKPSYPEIKKRLARGQRNLAVCGMRYGTQGRFRGGTWIAEFTLDEKGRVTQVKVFKELENPKVSRCLIKTLKGFRFPKLQAGPKTFKLPLHFH